MKLFTWYAGPLQAPRMMHNTVFHFILFLFVVGAFSVWFGQLPCDRCSFNGGHVWKLCQCYSRGRCTTGRRLAILFFFCPCSYWIKEFCQCFVCVTGSVGLVCICGAFLSSLGWKRALWEERCGDGPTSESDGRLSQVSSQFSLFFQWFFDVHHRFGA